MINKLIGGAIGVGLLLASITPSFAATNDTTGALSKNFSVKVDAKLALLRARNLGSITQTTNTSSTTGGNQSNQNTSNLGGGVSAGKATADGMAGSTLNDNTATLNQTACDCANGTEATGNSITGYDSTNVAVVANVKLAAIKLRNEGYVVQNTTTTANSGGNTANQNTIGGSVLTGDASATSTVVSTLNTNTITINQ